MRTFEIVSFVDLEAVLHVVLKMVSDTRLVTPEWN